jgi:hypothetical protein
VREIIEHLQRVPSREIHLVMVPHKHVEQDPVLIPPSQLVTNRVLETHINHVAEVPPITQKPDMVVLVLRARRPDARQNLAKHDLLGLKPQVQVREQNHGTTPSKRYVEFFLDKTS